MPGFSIGGLATSLPTDEIIAELMRLQRRPIDRLKVRQAEINARQSAVHELNTRLRALRDKAAALSTTNAFTGASAASSDPGVLTASGAAGSAAGTYQLTVQKLAQAHQLRSDGLADIDSTTVGTGTLTLRVGTNAPVTLTIDGTNNTLAGLRDAINAAKAGVSATIVDDGSGTNSKRLILSSGTTGVAGAITLTADLTGGEALAFADLQPAQNAQVVLGSGPGALTVSKSSNTFSDVVPGATITLVKESDTPVTVTVKPNLDGVVSAVRDFVTQYNEFREFVASQSKYDAATKQSGLLFGDYDTLSISDDVITAITAVVPGLPRAMSALADIGVTLSDKGVLELNEAALRERMAADPNGVARVFAATGTSTSDDLAFVSAGNRAKSSAAGAYEVRVTQAATQARVTAGAAQTGPLAQDETLILNGTSIALTAGMTQEEVVAAINAKSDVTSVVASATGADGTGVGSYLTLTQKSYGSAATISVISTSSNDSGVSSGVGNVQVTPASPWGQNGAGTGAAGLDVAGTINGEAATGRGQFLTGNSGNATTDGLQVRVTGTATGVIGSVAVTLGVGHTVKTLLDSITDPVSGRLKQLLDSFATQTTEITRQITEKEAALVEKEARLREKFARLEGTMSKLQSQAQRLSAQLAAFRQKGPDDD